MLLSFLAIEVFLVISLDLITINYGSNRWPNHDISTLKLLQIVHRHGDRSPLNFPPNDPFGDTSYWKEGIGQLTTKGKYRMYKLGQFIREQYNTYLGEGYSPREVYARSSISKRCLESISCLLSGAYPPKPIQWNNGMEWKWNNGIEWKWNNRSDAELRQLWQHFPIETFRQSEDLVLNQERRCPIADKELDIILKSDKVKKFLEDNNELYKNMSKVVGHEVNSIKKGGRLHSTLRIEIDSGYYWTNVWTKEEEETIVQKLYNSHLMSYRIAWDSPVIKRLRAGGLVKELNSNFQKVIDNPNHKKLYVYSTHDKQIAAFMQAFNIFNDNLVPFGATLLFELHEKMNGVNNEHFIEIYYHNQTLTGIPHTIHLTNCENKIQCPALQYFDSTKHLIYSDFDIECND